MKKIQIRAWNIGYETGDHRVINGEKVYQASTRIGAAIKILYAKFMYDYVEISNIINGGIKNGKI